MNTLWCFKSVPDFLLYLAQPSTTIDQSAPVEKGHLELNLWPSSMRALTDRQTEVTKRIISPASWSINMIKIIYEPPGWAPYPMQCIWWLRENRWLSTWQYSWNITIHNKNFGNSLRAGIHYTLSVKLYISMFQSCADNCCLNYKI